MKKNPLVLISVILSFFVLSTTVGAATFDFSYDKETRAMTLEGTIGTTEHQACLVYIYDASKSSSDISDTSTPVFADMAVTSDGGIFGFSKTLTDTYPSGKYRISVVSADDSWNTEFMYTNNQSVENLLSLINGATSATALENVITSSATELGIDTDIYNPIKKNICLFIFGNKPSNGFETSGDFINILEQCTTAARIKNGEDIASVLKENAKAISINFLNDYSKFDSDVILAINKELTNADYSKNLLSAIYPELRAVAFMKAAPTWQALKNAFYGVDNSGNTIVSNFSVINPDLSVYNKVVNKDNVFTRMFKQKSNLTSVDNIKRVFSECATYIYREEQDNTSSNKGNSSGGGGFSGGISGPVSVEPGYINQAPEIIKPALFTDTDINAWYYPSIETLSSLSLIKGYEDKTFKPDASITRAEFTKLVVEVAQYTDTMIKSDSNIEFNDVSSSDWYAETVIKAARAGLVTGSDNKFQPNNQITRQDAAVILYRLISSVKSLDGNVSFSDSDTIADYAKTAVSSLASAKIISGMGDGSFSPLQNLTRAQAAKLLCGVLENLS